MNNDAEVIDLDGVKTIKALDRIVKEHPECIQEADEELFKLADELTNGVEPE